MKNNVKVAIAFVSGIVALLAAEGAPAQPTSQFSPANNPAEVVIQDSDLEADTALMDNYQSFLSEPMLSMNEMQEA